MPLTRQLLSLNIQQMVVKGVGGLASFQFFNILCTFMTFENINLHKTVLQKTTLLLVL